jgi:hypothetical protein
MRPRWRDLVAVGRRFGTLSLLSTSALVVDFSALAYDVGDTRELPPVQVSREDAPRHIHPPRSRKPAASTAEIMVHPTAAADAGGRGAASGPHLPPTMTGASSSMCSISSTAGLTRSLMRTARS